MKGQKRLENCIFDDRWKSKVFWQPVSAGGEHMDKEDREHCRGRPGLKWKGVIDFDPRKRHIEMAGDRSEWRDAMRPVIQRMEPPTCGKQNGKDK